MKVNQTKNKEIENHLKCLAIKLKKAITSDEKREVVDCTFMMLGERMHYPILP